MTAPWAKVPVDLERYDPRLRRMRTAVKASFGVCFRAAHRQGEYKGHLVQIIGGQPTAMSLRALASLGGIPSSTFQQHVVELLEPRIFIARGLDGFLVVPLVLDVERRLTRTRNFPTDTLPNDTSPISTAGVENLFDDPAGVSATRTERPSPGQPLLLEVQDVEDVYVAGPSAEPRENPPDWSDSFAAADQVPKAIESPEIRVLLAKLACRLPAWRVVLTDARDRGWLKRMYREEPRRLLDALEDAADQGGHIRKPAAWLMAAVYPDPERKRVRAS